MISIRSAQQVLLPVHPLHVWINLRHALRHANTRRTVASVGLGRALSGRSLLRFLLGGGARRGATIAATTTATAVFLFLRASLWSVAS